MHPPSKELYNCMRISTTMGCAASFMRIRWLNLSRPGLLPSWEHTHREYIGFTWSPCQESLERSEFWCTWVLGPPSLIYYLPICMLSLFNMQRRFSLTHTRLTDNIFYVTHSHKHSLLVLACFKHWIHVGNKDVEICTKIGLSKQNPQSN